VQSLAAPPVRWKAIGKPSKSVLRWILQENPPRALEGAEFVQENGPERPDLKHEMYRRMDAAVGADVLLASYAEQSDAGIDNYSNRAVLRVWKADASPGG
jgi:3-hydroxyacyl-CoA dehydrogenase, NAD binding domain